MSDYYYSSPDSEFECIDVDDSMSYRSDSSDEERPRTPTDALNSMRLEDRPDNAPQAQQDYAYSSDSDTSEDEEEQQYMRRVRQHQFHCLHKQILQPGFKKPEVPVVVDASRDQQSTSEETSRDQQLEAEQDKEDEKKQAAEKESREVSNVKQCQLYNGESTLSEDIKKEEERQAAERERSDQPVYKTLWERSMEITKQAKEEEERKEAEREEAERKAKLAKEEAEKLAAEKEEAERKAKQAREKEQKRAEERKSVAKTSENVSSVKSMPVTHNKYSYYHSDDSSDEETERALTSSSDDSRPPSPQFNRNPAPSNSSRPETSVKTPAQMQSTKKETPILATQRRYADQESDSERSFDEESGKAVTTYSSRSGSPQQNSRNKVAGNGCQSDRLDTNESVSRVSNIRDTQGSRNIVHSQRQQSYEAEDRRSNDGYNTSTNHLPSANYGLNNQQGDQYVRPYYNSPNGNTGGYQGQNVSNQYQGNTPNSVSYNGPIYQCPQQPYGGQYPSYYQGQPQPYNGQYNNYYQNQAPQPPYGAHYAPYQIQVPPQPYAGQYGYNYQNQAPQQPCNGQYNRIYWNQAPQQPYNGQYNSNYWNQAPQQPYNGQYNNYQHQAPQPPSRDRYDDYYRTQSPPHQSRDRYDDSYRTQSPQQQSRDRSDNYYQGQAPSQLSRDRYNDYCRSQSPQQSRDRYDDYYRTQSPQQQSRDRYNDYHRNQALPQSSRDRYDQYHHNQALPQSSRDRYNQYHQSQAPQQRSENQYDNYYHNQTQHQPSRERYDDYYRSQSPQQQSRDRYEHRETESEKRARQAEENRLSEEYIRNLSGDAIKADGIAQILHEEKQKRFSVHYDRSYPSSSNRDKSPEYRGMNHKLRTEANAARNASYYKTSSSNPTSQGFRYYQNEQSRRY